MGKDNGGGCERFAGAGSHLKEKTVDALKGIDQESNFFTLNY